MRHEKSFVVGNGLCKSYVILAWRTLMENKFIAMISVAGLVIGLTASFLAGLFILDELAFDRHLRNKDRLYRVTSTFQQDGHSHNSALTDGYVANSLKRVIPEVQHATRLLASDEAFLFNNEGSAFKEKIIFTDSSFLDVFGFELIQGNRHQCLAHPSSLIVSERVAMKLFGSDWFGKEVVGRVVSIDGRIPVTITGVFKDIPLHTHFRSNLFASVPSGQESWMSDDSKVYTYVLLHQDVDRDHLREKLLSLLAGSYFPGESAGTRLNLQPVPDIYLFSTLQDENAFQGNIKNIYALVLIALFLIVITVVNFANLYTANSFTRLKEIGVRKTLGAVQMQLRLQFMGETVVITLISLVIAFSVTALLLPSFNVLTGKQFLLSSLFEANVLLLTGGVTAMISLLAGIYPALYLSGRKTTEALKGLKNRPNSSAAFRKGLIMVQFGLSSVMIILSLVALNQVKLINEKDVGFDKENTIALSNPYMLGSVPEIISFRNELSGVKGVEEISITGYTPSQKRWEHQWITFPARNELSPVRRHASWLLVDENFIRTMGIQLVEGRDFLPDHESDREAIIVNETAAAEFHLDPGGKGALGAELSFKDTNTGVLRHFKIVGVVADFNFGSLHERVKPIVMRLGYHRFEMAVRLSPAYPQRQIIQDIDSVWKKNVPVIPFEYSFIKTRFDTLHQSDIAASYLFSAFCLLTVVMSALGLFSMVTYSVTSRRKEFGIRKLLGASGFHIAFFVAGDFLKLILISYAIALPFAWFLASRWIDNFAYKTEITWRLFTVTGLILVSVSALSLAYQSMQASLANPVDHLKQE